jgi:hypothetical protein
MIFDYLSSKVVAALNSAAVVLKSIRISKCVFIEVIVIGAHAGGLQSSKSFQHKAVTTCEHSVM